MNNMRTAEEKRIEQEEVFAVFCVFVIKIALLYAIVSLLGCHH